MDSYEREHEDIVLFSSAYAIKRLKEKNTLFNETYFKLEEVKQQKGVEALTTDQVYAVIDSIPGAREVIKEYQRLVKEYKVWMN